MLWKKTIVMLITFVVLAIAALVVSAMPFGDQHPGLKLPPVEKQDITKIEILRDEQTVVTLVKVETTWRLSPEDFLADERKVEAALKMIADLATGSMVSQNASNHRRYGVQDGGLAVTVSTTKGEVLRFIVGNPSSDKRGNYLRLPGDKRVFVSAHRLQTTFNKDQQAWRDRRVVVIEPDQVDRLELLQSGQALGFRKDEQGKWLFDPAPEDLPRDYRLDSDKVEQVVRSMANLSTISFEDSQADRAKLGLAPPWFTAKVALKDGNDVVMHMGTDADKKVAAQREGDNQVFYLNEYQAKRIRQDVEGLRDLHVARFDPDQAEKVEVADGSKKLTFHKGAQWELATSSDEAPPGFRLDPQKVDDLVNMAARFQGKSVVDGAPAASGVASSGKALSVTLKDGTVKRIRIGRQKGDKEVFVAGDQGWVFLATTYSADRLIKNLDDFKVTARGQQPMVSPDALKNLPPEIAKQLMEKQRQQIMQQQLIRQMLKKQEQEGGQEQGKP